MKRVEQLNKAPEGKTSFRCYPEQGSEIAQKLVSLLHDKNIKAEEFRVEEGRLDEVFRKITRTV